MAADRHADRPTLLSRAASCATIANSILTRERAIAEGNAGGDRREQPYGKGEDREALLDVAGQYIELAKAYAQIAAATTPAAGPPRPAPPVRTARYEEAAD